MDYLLFKMEGILQAWGIPSPMEIRKTSDHPSKSGVVGYLGACLGYPAGKQIADLCADLGYACRVDSPGSLMSDFHTVGVPTNLIDKDAVGGPRYLFETRADYNNPVLLEKARSKGCYHTERGQSILSTREYLLWGGLHGVPVGDR